MLQKSMLLLCTNQTRFFKGRDTPNCSIHGFDSPTAQFHAMDSFYFSSYFVLLNYIYNFIFIMQIGIFAISVGMSLVQAAKKSCRVL